MNNLKKKLPSEDIITLLKSTTGHKKLLKYIKEIIKEESFNKRVQKIREKHNIKLETKPEASSSGFSLEDDIFKLLAEYDLEFECFHFMMAYITKDKFIEEYIGDMLFTEDILDTKNLLKKKGGSEIGRLFPVVVRVSPYASKKDIVDYIEKLYHYSIEPIQKINRKERTLGKVNNKKIITERKK